MFTHGHKTVLRFLVGLLLALGCIAFMPGSAYAGVDDDYPAQWRDPVPQDSVLDTWGEYNRECTSWVSWALSSRNHFEIPFHGFAKDWSSLASNAGYTTDSKPAIGAVAWWAANVPGSSQWGHVAYVKSISADGNTVTVSQYNLDFTGHYSTSTFAKSYPSGYIHFKDLSNTPDFNGDHLGDLAWHQGANLVLYSSAGQNGTFSWIGSTGGIGIPTWAGAGDVNGDGISDVIWYTGTTISVFRWWNSAWSLVGQTTGVGPPDYAVVGDFNGDHRADLAWHSGSTLTMFSGTTGGTFSFAGSTNGISSPLWGAGGDVNGDGKAEVIWYSNNTFTTYGWTGSSWGWINAVGGVGTADDAAVGDFNGDHKADVAWHQGTSLNLFVGATNGTLNFVGGTSGIGSADWNGGTDVDGNGAADVVWHQGTTLYTYKWVNGANFWSLMGQTSNIGAPDKALASG